MPARSKKLIREERTLLTSMDSQPASSERSSAQPRGPYLTWSAVALCIALTLTHWSAQRGIFSRIDAILSATPEQIWDGRYYGLLSTIFIHGNVLHLAFNVACLLILGAILEQTVHPLQWLAFFIGSSAVATCTELAASGVVAIGASGAVYAIF